MGSEAQHVSVWWDVQSCSLPEDCEPLDVVGSIKRSLAARNINGPMLISAYGDMTLLPSFVSDGLSRTDVKLHHIPLRQGRKDGSDKALLVAMISWALDHPPPAAVLLLCGDCDFVGALTALRQRQYTVLVAYSGSERACESLISAATYSWPWQEIAQGECPSLPATSSPSPSKEWAVPPPNEAVHVEENKELAGKAKVEAGAAEKSETQGGAGTGKTNFQCGLKPSASSCTSSSHHPGQDILKGIASEAGAESKRKEVTAGGNEAAMHQHQHKVTKLPPDSTVPSPLTAEALSSLDSAFVKDCLFSLTTDKMPPTRANIVARFVELLSYAGRKGQSSIGSHGYYQHLPAQLPPQLCSLTSLDLQSREKGGEQLWTAEGLEGLFQRALRCGALLEIPGKLFVLREQPHGWSWVDPESEQDPYSAQTWAVLRQHLHSNECKKTIHASKSRYHAARLLQQWGPAELQSMAAGELVHLLQLAISQRRWLVVNPSHWQPLKLNVPPLPQLNPILQHPNAFIFPPSSSAPVLPQPPYISFNSAAVGQPPPLLPTGCPHPHISPASYSIPRAMSRRQAAAAAAAAATPGVAAARAKALSPKIGSSAAVDATPSPPQTGVATLEQVREWVKKTMTNTRSPRGAMSIELGYMHTMFTSQTGLQLNPAAIGFSSLSSLLSSFTDIVKVEKVGSNALYCTSVRAKTTPLTTSTGNNPLEPRGSASMKEVEEWLRVTLEKHRKLGGFGMEMGSVKMLFERESLHVLDYSVLGFPSLSALIRQLSHIAQVRVIGNGACYCVPASNLNGGSSRRKGFTPTPSMLSAQESHESGRSNNDQAGRLGEEKGACKGQRMPEKFETATNISTVKASIPDIIQISSLLLAAFCAAITALPWQHSANALEEEAFDLGGSLLAKKISVALAGEVDNPGNDGDYGGRGPADSQGVFTHGWTDIEAANTSNKQNMPTETNSGSSVCPLNECVDATSCHQMVREAAFSLQHPLGELAAQDWSKVQGEPLVVPTPSSSLPHSTPSSTPAYAVADATSKTASVCPSKAAAAVAGNRGDDHPSPLAHNPAPSPPPSSTLPSLWMTSRPRQNVPCASLLEVQVWLEGAVKEAPAGGLDLSCVKSRFEREIGKRLDLKLLGFSKMKDFATRMHRLVQLTERGSSHFLTPA